MGYPRGVDILSVEALIAFIGIALTVGGHFVVVARWRGAIEARMVQAEKDREVLHERIGAKEAALEEQLKELTKAVTDLRIEVARLSERERIEGSKHD